MPDGSWVVESIAIGGELQPTIGERDLTFEISEGRVAGDAGVNRYMGQLESEGKMMPTLATTLMAGPEEMMAQERLFLELLARVEEIEQVPSGINLVGDGLILVTLRTTGT